MADYLQYKHMVTKRKAYRGKVQGRALKEVHTKAQAAVDYAKRVEARWLRLKAVARD